MESNETSNNFCGTAEYLSPEVLNDLPACFGSDLWALGCIIFQMFTGRPPFRGENDYLTFQEILTHDSATMEFPSSVPDTARALIRALLVRDIDARLTNYEDVKCHPFFEGIHWNSITSAPAPIVPAKTPLSEPTIDGAAPNWSISTVFSDMGSPLSVSQHMSHHNFTQPVSITQPPQRRQSNQVSSIHSNFLDNNEGVLFQSDVKLHASMFMKKSRELVFTSNGRLLLINAKTNTHEIFQWDQRHMRIVAKGDSTFDIRTTSSSFRLTDNLNGAQKWCQVLNSFIK